MIQDTTSASPCLAVSFKFRLQNLIMFENSGDFDPNWSGVQVLSMHIEDCILATLIVDASPLWRTTGRLARESTDNDTGLCLDKKQAAPLLAIVKAEMWKRRYGGPYYISESEVPWTMYRPASPKPGLELLHLHQLELSPLQVDFKQRAKMDLAALLAIPGMPPGWETLLREILRDLE